MCYGFPVLDGNTGVFTPKLDQMLRSVRSKLGPFFFFFFYGSIDSAKLVPNKLENLSLDSRRL